MHAAPPTPPRIELARLVVTPNSSSSVDELFARAEAEYQARRYVRAAEGFDGVYALDPSGPRAEDALFMAATSHDYAARPRDALRRYQKFAGEFPRSEHARTAMVRATRLHTYLGHWFEAGRIADKVVTRYRGLRPFELIAVHSAKALSLLAESRDEQASYYVEKARSVIEDNRLDAAGQIPRDLAQVYYALGEIRRIRAERIKFVPVPKNFTEVLEQRCQLVLDAQSSYSDTMRAHDAHWSMMAGYRVGELYQRLHADLMLVPPPDAAYSAAKKLLFEGAMRLRYSILLEKAQSIMTHTLRMADRTQEASAWVVRARRALVDLDEAMKTEQEAIDALPYSRAELQQALSDLERTPGRP